MPNDLMTFNALCCELNHLLSGGRIEKLYQPEKDEIALSIRNGKEKYNLVISCNAQNPRIHISEHKKDNPITAPTFCMHLRKHLSNGSIESISILNNDRVIDITIIAKNELKDTVKFHLISEMMGRYSNILLINDKYIILDAIKQVSFDNATKRCILPSMKYEFVEQPKISPFDKDAMQKYLANYTQGEIEKYISTGISGLSPSTSKEIISRCGISDFNPATHSNLVAQTISTFFNINSDVLYSPCVQLDKNGVACDYFVLPYQSLDCEFVPCENLSKAIDTCVSVKDQKQRQREHTKHLLTAIKNYRSRNDKKLKKAIEKLKECSNADIYRKWGELITANLHKINKGDSVLITQDYYVEDMPEITIPLNTLLSPSKSAQEHFKKYAKLKRTLEIITEQIKETESTLKYADSIETSLSLCDSASDILQIEEELRNIGILRQSKNKNTKHIKTGKPFIYEYMDFVILVGKNNIQNDKLTFKSASNSDLWLHTLKYHGTHVIISAEGRQIPNEVITFACELAGYYSQGKENDKVAVDYTQVRNVKKDSSGNLGMVTYTNQSTAYVKPNNHLEFLMQE